MFKTTLRRNWIILLFLSMALRLIALNGAPLAPDEALQALPALNVARGGKWPATAESPLLLVGNTLLFAIFGPGDGTARLLPALAGIALVAVPFLWRRRLGVGALVTAGLLTLSPVAIFAARHLSGATVGVLGAALVTTALFTISDEENRWESFIVPLGVALGLTGGPTFYDVLVPGLLAWGTYNWMKGKRPTLPPTLWRGVLIGVAGAFLISVGLGWRWNGWAGPGAGFTAWLTGGWGLFASEANVAHLFLYEPLTLCLAAVGFAFTLKRSDTLGLGLCAWIFLGSLVVLLRQQAEPLALLSPIIPLAILGGRGVQALVEERENPALAERVHLLLSFIFWIFAGLALARQTSYLRNEMEGLLILLVLLIQVVMAVAFATISRPLLALRGLLLGTAAALCLVQVSFGVGVSFLRPSHPAEPLVTVATSPDLRNLQRTVTDIVNRRALSPERLEIAVVEGDPGVTAAVAWALHDFVGTERVALWPEDDVDFIIAPEYHRPEDEVRLLQGMRFVAAVRSGGPVPPCELHLPPVCPAPIDWYLYRKTPVPFQQEHVILWTEPEPSPGEREF